MPLPIYTDENPIVCATTAIRDALLKDPAYKVAGLSVQVGSTIWWLNLDLGSWSPASNVPAPLPLTITNAGGAVANEVVRLAAAGVLAKAQADTTAHAAAVVGVWDGVSVVPFSAQPIVKFVSAPIVGQPCYLSATVAGAMTCTAPGVGYVSVPQDLLVLEDKSVGSNYAARVGINKATTGSYSSRDDFKRYAAQLTGMNLAKSEFLGSDFTPSELIDSGTGPMLPNLGRWDQPCLAGTEYSSIYTNTAGTMCLVERALPALNLGAQRWALSFRWRQQIANNAFYVALSRANSDGTTFTEGCQMGYSQYYGHSTGLMFCAGNYDPYFGEWSGATLVSPVEIGTLGVTWYQGLMYSKGDGNIYGQIDNSVVTAAPVAASAATKSALLRIASNSVYLDWIYLISERTDY